MQAGQWERRYETLLKSQDIGDIYSIFASMSKEEMEWHGRKLERQQQDGGVKDSGGGGLRGLVRKFNPLRLFTHAPKATAEVTGAAVGAAGAGFAASTLAASTTTIFGIGIITAAAPVAVVAGSVVAGGLGMYGLFKTTGFFNKLQGAREQRDDLKKQGYGNITPLNQLHLSIFTPLGVERIQLAYNYYALSNAPMASYHFLKCLTTPVEEASYTRSGQEVLQSDASILKLTEFYKQANRKQITICKAMLKLNIEYLQPRVEQESFDEILQNLESGWVLADDRFIAPQLEIATYAICKVLLFENPENEPIMADKAISAEASMPQKEQQIKLMREKAEQYGTLQAFEQVMSETRPIKLNQSNYLEYLKEILGILGEAGGSFLTQLESDIKACVEVDGSIDSWEQKILDSIASLKA